MVRDDSIDIITCYKSACLYCIEDDIPVLFYKIPESEKNFHTDMYDVMLMNDIKKILVMKLVAFWTHGITSEVNRLNYGYSTVQNMFSFAVERGNKLNIFCKK